MFAVIFEVRPKKEQFDEYLNLAKFLKPELENRRLHLPRPSARLQSYNTSGKTVLKS
jgi:hypothetical protein